jgi:hypothetical protein
MEPKDKQLEPKRNSLPSKCDTCGGGFHNGFYGSPTTCDDCIVEAEEKGKK